MSVVDLDAHRPKPGILWWSGLVRCIECDHQHIAVVEMPDWAACPVSVDCPECPHMRSCIPVAGG